MLPLKRPARSLSRKKFLITSGPTWVAIDPMRVISNRASGELGQKLALYLSAKGARVTLLQGPVANLLASKKILVKSFRFYDELDSLLKAELKKKYDAVIHNAAVSDYQLKKPFRTKLDSREKTLSLSLVPTKKLINKIKALAPKTFLVGFKLEDFKNETDIVEQSRELIAETHCDIVIANTLKKGYKAYLLNHKAEIFGQANSRAQLAQKLVSALMQNLG